MTKTKGRPKLVRDWTPRELPGGFYCSPACGGTKGFCKKEDHDKAVQQATELSKRLGVGWTPHVWENLGWHWEVYTTPFRGKDSCYPMDLLGSGIIVRYCPHRQSEHRYEAEFRVKTDGVTQFFASGETAEDAIGRLRQDVRTYIARLEEMLRDTI